ncbi:MAG TPA: hypothetical protein VHR18_01460 [Solirubrobacterales bacterium]|nr:hypothetical protein [Solirubrobacterales bacterium]
MKTPSPERLRGVAEALTRLFYCLLAVAFLAAVFGSPGRGLFLLALGGLAHVARVGAEEMIALQGRRRAVPTRSRRSRPSGVPREAAPVPRVHARRA